MFLKHILDKDEKCVLLSAKGRHRKANPMPLVLISSMMQVIYSHELHHLLAILCCHGRMLHDLEHLEKLGLRRL